jgi:cytochrome P450
LADQGNPTRNHIVRSHRRHKPSDPAARRPTRTGAKAELEYVVDDLVQRRPGESADRSTVRDLLINQPELTDHQIPDQVMTLLLAGHETTAMAITWPPPRSTGHRLYAPN